MRTTVFLTLAVLMIGSHLVFAAEAVKAVATIGNAAISTGELDTAIGARLFRLRTDDTTSAAPCSRTSSPRN
jgi:hypothetical protein